MGQAVKYATLGASIAVILSLVAVFLGELIPSSFFGTFNTVIGGFLSRVSPYFLNVRGAINYMLRGGAVVYSVLIWVDLLLVVVLVPVRATVTVVRFINQ